MKGKEAIAKTRARLESEFNERKQQRLTGMYRHRSELEEKIQKLQSELQSLNSKISEVEGATFRCTYLTEESRRAQSETSKQSRNNSI
jgi:predicted nuclease with TOPRIM domain